MVKAYPGVPADPFLQHVNWELTEKDVQAAESGRPSSRQLQVSLVGPTRAERVLGYRAIVPVSGLCPAFFVGPRESGYGIW